MDPDFLDGAVASAVLIKKGLLSRVFRVRVFRTEYRVAYTALGGVRLEVHSERTLSSAGWVEDHRFLGDYAAPLPRLLPNGAIQEQPRRSHIPRINFSLGSVPARLDGRRWPWHVIRGVRFELGATLLYADGCYATEEAPVSSGALWDQDLDGTTEPGDAAHGPE